MALTDELSGVCEVREPWGEDTVDGVRPQVVARPASTAETSALLRECATRGLAVTVRGHGTKLGWGRPPARLDVVLETQRMDSLVEHAAGDLIASVGAGMPLSRLGELLAPARQQLVVDDLLAEEEAAGRGSTVGGMLATAMAGPRRAWVGGPRDLLIGVTLVRADGTVAHSGGKVVKNVAGYDLGKLLVGSYGTLGVITAATFRLHPRPAAEQWVHTEVALPALPAVLSAVVHSQLYPAAVEVEHHGAPDAPARVAVLLCGTEDGVTARAAAAADLVSGALGQRPDGHVGAGEVWWPFRLPAGGEPDRTLVKLTSQLSGVATLVQACAEHGVEVRGSAGTGVLHGALVGADPDRVAAVVGSLRDLCTGLGGAAVVLDAPAAVKDAVDTWGPVPGLALMRRVKQQFDPDGTLSPGRFVGGI